VSFGLVGPAVLLAPAVSFTLVVTDWLAKRYP
jgi:hypothetical protein